MKIAVILPSRGLMFSQTADEILQNLKGYDYKFFFSHRKPIPECFEKPANRALLDDSITHLWFVEDDMILPPDTLKKLIAKNKAVVTADYPVNRDGRGSIFEVEKRIVFCGTGCLLVQRGVFDELKSPYFRSDIKWTIKNHGEYIKMNSNKTSNLDGYGFHDVNFGMNLYRRDIPIHKINKVLGQRKLVRLGKSGSNDGTHLIEEWTEVVPNDLLNEIKKWPALPSGRLVSVITPSGTVSVSSDHAKTMVKKKLGKLAPRRYLVVDEL